MQRLMMWCYVAYTDAVDCHTTCVPSSKTEWKISNNKTKNDTDWLFTWWLDRTVIRWSVCPAGVYGTPMKTAWLLPLTATTLCSLSASCSGSAAKTRNYDLAKQTIVPGCTHVITAIHRPLVGLYETVLSVYVRLNPLTHTIAIWVQLQSTMWQRRSRRPSFVIFDIRSLWRSALSVRVPGCQKLQMTA